MLPLYALRPSSGCKQADPVNTTHTWLSVFAEAAHAKVPSDVQPMRAQSTCSPLPAARGPLLGCAQHDRRGVAACSG